jgi:hypothetical protein
VSVDYFAVGVMAFECMFGRVILLLNNCVCRDRMWESPEKRLEIIYSQNRCRLRETRYQEAGQLRQLTL